MGTSRQPPKTASPTNVVESLVNTLLDVFTSTRDLYITLKRKEKRDHERHRRVRGYPASRRDYYSEDEDDDIGDEPIVTDKAAVNREFENGLADIGPNFAVGDVITQTALQSQIIVLQSTLITVFLYGPTSTDPISTHLTTLLSASRIAGTASVDALAAQKQRMLGAPLPIVPPTPVTPRAAAFPPSPPYPVTTVPSSHSSPNTVGRSRRTSWPSSPPPTVHGTPSLVSRPRVNRTDTESTAFSGPTSVGTHNPHHSLFCLYAIDLQRHPDQLLSSTISENDRPYCPYCNRSLHLSPGRSWEISKMGDRGERIFQIKNRFVVKCHREGEDEGYSCVLCSDDRTRDSETVCGDVKALVRHIWQDHTTAELQAEADVVEVVDDFSPVSVPLRGRSQSRTGRRRGSGRVEREVEIVKIKNPAPEVR